MDTGSISFGLGRYQSTGMREFYVDPANQQKYRTDDTWIKVPRDSDYSYREGIESCQIDLWGEETCSVMEEFPQRRNGPTVSCRNAYGEDPKLFNAVREHIESEPWTVREMKRAMQWVFNCFGKLPPEACNGSTAQN